MVIHIFTDSVNDLCHFMFVINKPINHADTISSLETSTYMTHKFNSDHLAHIRVIYSG